MVFELEIEHSLSPIRPKGPTQNVLKLKMEAYLRGPARMRRLICGAYLRDVNNHPIKMNDSGLKL